MRLALKFGNDEQLRHMGWWNPIGNFPTLVKYNGKKWEFVMYDTDKTGVADNILYFSQLASYDPNWHATTFQDIEHLLDRIWGPTCECGKDKHKFTSHSHWCPKGKK